MKLEEIKIIKRQIDELEFRIANLRNPIKGMNPESQHGSGDDDQVLHNVQKIIQLEKQLNERRSILLEDIDYIDSVIVTIENKTIRTTMYYKYIDCLTTKEIAHRMAYTSRQIDRYLKQGREQIKKDFD